MRDSDDECETPNLEHVSFCAIGNFGETEQVGKGDNALQHFLMMGGDSSSGEEVDNTCNIGANIKRKAPCTDFN